MKKDFVIRCNNFHSKTIDTLTNFLVGASHQNKRQEITDLVICTKDILNGKLHFLFSANLGDFLATDRKPLK